MSNQQHTSGPWNSVATMSSDLDNIRYISGADCEKVATISYPIGISQDTAMANARLIAAAPELLHALTLLYDTGTDSTMFDFARSQARAAIAKATA